MKTIYKSCYFITATAFSILAQNTVMELFLTSSGQPIPGVNVNIQEQ
jgi:hypothetical protein